MFYLWSLCYFKSHGAPGAQSLVFTTGQTGLNLLWNTSSYQEQTIQLWTMLANYYQNRSEIVGFDLLNEPFGAPSASASC